MRFVVIGPGAIGGVVGGRLFEHGYDVALVARGAHYDAIHVSGLRLETSDTSATLDVPVFRNPDEVGIGEGDVVVLAVKSQDTAAAVHTLALAAPATVPVFCFQNGVDNERVALRSFPFVYGVCVWCPATHLHPGVVRANSAPVTGILDLGRHPAGTDDTAEAVAAALRASTFSSEARAQISRWKYAKLLSNLANAVEAVCGLEATRGPITRLARDEGVACLRAAGIDFAGPDEEAARRGDLLRIAARSGGSSWQSLARSAGTVEADYLNGEIALLGRMTGVPTPVNGALQHHANRMARERVAPGSMTEDEFLRSAGATR